MIRNKTLFARIALTITAFMTAAPSLFAALPTPDTNYINDLIGDRATGLGGAFTAVSDSPEGAWYNPAGLVFAYDNQISLSVNSYKNKQIEIKKALGDQPYNQNISSFYPSFFGIVQTLGDFKMALTIMNQNNEILDQDDFVKGVQEPFLDTNTKATSDVDINYNITDNTLMGGISLAAFLSKNISLGASAYMVHRERQTIFKQNIRYRNVPDAALTSKGYATSATNSVYTENTDYTTDSMLGAIGKLGMQIMPSDLYSIGLSVGFGSIFSHDRTKETSYNQAGVNYNSNTLENSETTPGANELPVEVRAGFALFPSKKLLISADVITHIANQNYLVNTEQVVVNGAVGAEYYVTESFPVSLGVFTNFANTPEITSSNSKTQMNADLYGISTAMSWQTRNSAVTLSGYYQFGSGKIRARSDNSIQNLSINMYQVSLTGSAKY